MKKTFLLFAASLSCSLPIFSARAQVADLRGGPLGVERVAAKANYAIYESARKSSADESCWIRIDLGRPYPIDSVKLYPVVFDSWDYYARPGFPVRFRIETSGSDDGSDRPVTIADHTGSDYEAAAVDQIDVFRPAHPVSGRYVELRVTRLPERDNGYYFELWKMEVWSGGVDVSENRLLTDSDRGFLGKHPLLRPQRPMGEVAVLNCPENVTPAASWRPVEPTARVPRSGVTVNDGLFRRTLYANAHYLLQSFSVDDMLKEFRERAGVPADGALRDLHTEWVDILPGSKAGRFLMGAGNQLRWVENRELRDRMNRIVDGIEACKQPNGYLMAYPERDILHFENGAYCRSWVTQGLIEAGIAGNPKAYPLLRGFYDWFNACPYLPELVRRGGQGRQGIIASTRLYFTPVGKPEDLQVVQRYYQENFWMQQLIDKDVDAIWKYPYDRPHCYLILSLESFLDLYMATGDRQYLDAAVGGWELFNEYYEHIGGSISISELSPYPPKSYLLRSGTGELCGNSFWAFLNQRFHLLYPEEEKYVAEIEKSIYNVAIANQTADGKIRYHARLIDRKEDGTDVNTCCEGQGTRLFGALPEFIYTQADDGVYVDLFAASSFAWEQDGTQMKLTMQTEFPYSRPGAGSTLINPRLNERLEYPYPTDIQIEVSARKKTPCKIRLRIPWWCNCNAVILVNGERVAWGKPGSYVTLDRKWSDKDKIQFSLPMAFRLTLYKGSEPDFKGKNAYAIEYGPLLMAVVGDSVQNGRVTLPFPPEKLFEKFKPSQDAPLHFTIEDSGLRLIPYFEISDESFTCYPFLEDCQIEGRGPRIESIGQILPRLLKD